MKLKSKAVAITASMTVAGIALGATIASAASSTSAPAPALQSGKYVFACVNPKGGIDYLEFRPPLPHQCWFPGEALWYMDAVPLAQPTPAASPATPTPTTSTPTPTPTSTTTTPAA